MKLCSLTHFQESDKYIAQADAVDAHSEKLKEGKVYARHEADFVAVDGDVVDYIDLSPKTVGFCIISIDPVLGTR